MEHSRDLRLFIGTYSRSGSRGIYSMRMDAATGALGAPGLAAETGNPTFLALGPGRDVLYAVRSSPQAVVAYAVPADGVLAPLSPPAASEAGAPCHVAADRTGRMLLATNYHTGEVAALAILSGGAPGSPVMTRHRGRGPHPTRQASAHPHSATFSPDNRFALVCDLGLDRVFTYPVDPGLAALGPGAPREAVLPPGTGPRHLAFGPGGRRVYVVGALANTITVLDYDASSGSLAPRQSVRTLPAGFAGESSAAEVSLHPGGAFLYASNRGHDSIACFAVDPSSGALEPAGFTPCGGRNPRHFAFSADGRWLACAHQDSGSVASFAVDPAGGRLSPTGSLAAVPAPVCVLFAG